jgi:hypothetical protein
LKQWNIFHYPIHKIRRTKIKIIIALSIFIFSVPLFPQNEAGRISGVIYTDYFYNTARDTGIANIPNAVLNGKKDFNGFELRRAYLTYDYKISQQFSSRFRLEADSRALTQNNRIGVFIKDANIMWRDYFPGHDIILGIQPPPAFEVSEAFYGFRSLEKTIMDLRGAVSSRDFGLAAKGIVTRNINYWVLIANNSGTSPETDNYKRAYAHLSITPVEKLTATIYGDIKFRDQITDPTNGTLLNNNVLTTAFFIGYSDAKNYSVGTEAFLQTTDNGFIRTSPDTRIDDLNTLGISVFGWLKVAEKLTATVRYDIYDPGLNDELENDRRNFIIAGLSYRPVDRVSIIPNIMIETYDDLPGQSIDASVTPRITVVYTY